MREAVDEPARSAQRVERDQRGVHARAVVHHLVEGFDHVDETARLRRQAQPRHACRTQGRARAGALTKDSLKGILDLDAREAVVLVPRVILTILFGFYPAPILDYTATSVDALVNKVSLTLEAAQQASAAPAVTH